MKREVSLKSILAILVIILLCLVSFGGIYIKDRNIMKNWLKDYAVGMDTGDTNIVKLDILEEEDSSDDVQDAESTGESENEATDSNDGQAKKTYTVDDYKKSKSIIEKRLKISGVDQYILRLDEKTGSLVMEFPEDTNVNVLNNVFSPGKIECKIKSNISEDVAESESSEESIVEGDATDAEQEAEAETTNEEKTKEISNQFTSIFSDKKAIKNIKSYITDKYVQENNIGYTSLIRMDIEFTNEAMKKFKEIKDGYVMPVDKDGKQVDNTIYIYLDGEKFYEGNELDFLEIAEGGTLPIRYGGYTNDRKVLNERLKVAESEKAALTTEEIPIMYSGNYGNVIHSNISKKAVAVIFALILAVMGIYLLIKYKLKGVFAELCILGFSALLLLILRWTSVQMSVASMVSIVAAIIAQFIYLIKVLNNENISPKVFNNETITFTTMIIPAFILGIVAAVLPALKDVGMIPGNIFDVACFGMVMFWGVIVFEIFNNIITRAILTNAKNK